MNQFKKAKQLRSETGQAIESITDLKTAGVTQKTDNTELSLTEETKVQQHKTNTDIRSDSEVTIINNTTPTSIESADNISMDTKTDIQTTAETKPIEPIPSTQAPENAATVTPAVLKQPVTEPAEAIIYNQHPLAENDAIGAQPTETIVYNHPVTQTETTVIGHDKTSYENVPENRVQAATPEILNAHNIPTAIPQAVSTPVPIVNQQTIPTYTAPAEYNPVPQTVAVQPHIESQPLQEVTAIKHNKSNKKSVPNIFAPKGEAKSMRKSLVLKPTSVKIAENYCEKNGGSFNELIQTLLDNFIDEYGL
ncbi:MAG: hypothetical protein K2P44_16465 [Lachnospiraceae bacterium]|nr:hypothetical protein [Lachnospiraceae bacterium]